MIKEFERYLIVLLFIMLIGLGACTKKTSPNTATEPTVTITDSVGKMKGIADALGCMFAPQTCVPNK